MARRNRHNYATPVAKKCSTCGMIVVKRWRRDRKPYCGDCAIQAVIDTASQMRNKSGPAYEKWRATLGPNGQPSRTPRG